MLITSVQNDTIKAVARLHHKKDRDKENLILIEGEHPIEEAIKAGLELKWLFYKEGKTHPFQDQGEEHEITDQVMAKISTTDTPPPIVAVAGKPETDWKNLFQTPEFTVLGLWEIQDPGNIGSIIRSACAFGASGIVGIGHHSDPYNPKVIRSSAGLVFRLPISHVEIWEELRNEVDPIKDLKIWGATANKGASYKNTPFTQKTLLLLGNEAIGLPKEAWQKATPLQIPMTPNTDSLNVSMAAAILLSEIYQQRATSEAISS